MHDRHSYGPLVVLLVVLLLAGLPFAAWLDMRNLSERILSRQATEIGRVIDDMRGFYASDVVGRLAHHPLATPTDAYKSVDGGIPIPATLSIELGKMISARNAAVKYRFVSDYPFKGREPHPLDAWEKAAILSLRADSKKPVVDITGSVFNREIRMAGPVLMGAACVACHNTHPESPKRDWKVGDVRGIQEISIKQPIAANILSFKFLLAYLVLAAIAGLTFILVQRRQAAAIAGINKELAESNDFLASISMKIAKYLSPQIYKSIFSGQRDVAIHTERKKLTIFFSDIKDFTSTTERLQPEDLTALLNEYFTEMSVIALRHGATVDKFIGDAMLVFFGDPETKGITEDARACLLMAVDMQRRLSQLNAEWRKRGIEEPFRARMGINTGFCNVGNFGSEDRMDYTIIGAEANLAARLQTIAEPGGIVLSYETYALVRDMVRARPIPPIQMKGISREVVPYVVEGLVEEMQQRANVFSEHATGVDLFIDLEVIDKANAQRTKKMLQEALSALEARVKA
ncbi:MAG TPA: adenylate/guanylate cyclase domain-containing protein [Xanthobacteraceae bacterium]|nr:adenylate/guanylate cyclase domain-containing protein [Xanthobacteraceae bacterium]